MNRSKLREIIITILYQKYIYESKNISYEIEDIIKENLNIDNSFVTEAITYINNHQKEIDNLANKYMKDWSINRLSKVDKAIISLGIYELTISDTPNIVAINEAIELSKKYSDEKVTKMINGVLDKILHEEVKDEK
jgi:N utilization substance protein B